MSNLTALVYYLANTSLLDARHPQPADETVTGPRSPYRLVKLYSDGTVEPVATDKVDVAIRWVRDNGWTRAWGYWINDNPALVWARLPQDFERAWGRLELRCACRYAGNGAARRYTSGAYAGSLVKVGAAGVIAPTRTRRQVWELRERYGHAYADDLLFTPVEVLEGAVRDYETIKRKLGRFYPGNVAQGRQRRAIAADRDAVLPLERSRNHNNLFRR